ncbi:hypothetical protein BU24DRAFT_425746 [Aaosphaeria arxii CBS 175.79]|uniref:gamma-glutamylcyclotransferase n=1 Tax=Aaosphaeria arxii CBS 175.79 TaxID=1450172 RepID=A0A6A5XF94_9PLEO|nr:uncharacterized protein BU24DRAFT_425746 [Aaosphaeria arxii CBS 175.79]KAF2011915.1 hypothetical protein BU24DRAFT_425746 [Aaosphaeria arxii CBS 175.79]
MSNSNVPMPPPRPGPPRIRTLYFAFGSNLHLQQMAERCPNSKYIGRATLPHFRWMINQRGYANVVRAEGYWVEGLIFEIDVEDERRLDKSEGVAKQCYVDRDQNVIAPCYRKTYETMIVHRAPSALLRRPVPWIVAKGGPRKVKDEALKQGYSLREHHQSKKEHVLVYWSPDFTRDAHPKREYIKRINNGVRDASVLGMCPDYVENMIRPFIPPDGQATTGTHVYPVKKEKIVSPAISRLPRDEGGAIRIQQSDFQDYQVRERSQGLPRLPNRPQTSRLTRSRSLANRDPYRSRIGKIFEYFST